MRYMHHGYFCECVIFSPFLLAFLLFNRYVLYVGLKQFVVITVVVLAARIPVKKKDIWDPKKVNVVHILRDKLSPTMMVKNAYRLIADLATVPSK